MPRYHGTTPAFFKQTTNTQCCKIHLNLMKFVFWCQKIKINRTYVFWYDIKCTRTENVKNFWRVNATPRLTNTGLILGNMQKIHVKPIVLYSGRWTRNGDSRVFRKKLRKIILYCFFFHSNFYFVGFVLIWLLH